MNARIDFPNPQDPSAPRLRCAFSAPIQVLVAHHLHEVKVVLGAVQTAVEQGSWSVGYVRYEAASAFDMALQTHEATGPLAWFAVYDKALPWPEETVAGYAEIDWQMALSRSDFDAAFACIQKSISAGQVYQVNYTAALIGKLHGSAPAFFAALHRTQPGGYAAYIEAGDEQVFSVSPELFFDWKAGILLARPMKGTAQRGITREEDAAYAAMLSTSPKERAENVMIVDLLRNDMSRIAKPHSVRVPVLFHTQALPTVWQMTSDIQAQTHLGTALVDVFGALFPCGSVTGAPKVRAMQMIHDLESAPRGVYCGAVGVVRPDGMGGIHATFNVPIRTVVLGGSATARESQVARCGIGSGITSDANASAEWDEWRYKRAFVERASKPFDILETLALCDGDFRNRTSHLARMAEAAAHFGYSWDATQIHACLEAMAEQYAQGVWRVRLLLDAMGQLRAQALATELFTEPVVLQLASGPLADAHSEFTRYKTTRRAHYDVFVPTDPAVFDTVLYNEAGEITECTRGNIAMLLDGRWITPPLDCGLLPGVGRAMVLSAGRIVQAVVRLEDIPRIQSWAFVNSLRGWIDATLIR